MGGEGHEMRHPEADVGQSRPECRIFWDGVMYMRMLWFADSAGLMAHAYRGATVCKLFVRSAAREQSTAIQRDARSTETTGDEVVGGALEAGVGVALHTLRRGRRLMS
ncbi:hypothetical protein BAUCODRAFT_212382 [Baudoinia panamericana UAMH 10762]|uniref:Uncharacterized protein n=1 Tax=Baudoinia panamericana (strain UAMH 10762) TaxID=717646 RepID=M2LI38_BAUPA|nr:uncharacterized protein BAUCODRAFT_212382 [Baudoinia panamericana UAMH 10762]EMC93847.1 hypothetical protein BAUCODRAFT_212382 [Baudoinia panamericana UAMH 10762]